MLVVLKFSSGLKDTTCSQDLHDTQNTLYDGTSLSNTQYHQMNLSETSTRNVDDVATSAVVGQDHSYESPVYHLVHLMAEIIKNRNQLNIEQLMFSFYTHLYALFY